MTGNPYLFILVTGAVSYLIRVLPLTLIRREIKNRFLRSFLHYVPYVTLAVMTFPSIITATSTPISAWIAFLAALYLGWRGKGLLPVACLACGAVFIVEMIVL